MFKASRGGARSVRYGRSVQRGGPHTACSAPRFLTRRLGWVVLLACCLLSYSRTAAAIKIRIQSDSSLEARAAPTGHGVELRGVLRDDASRPIPKATLRVFLTDKNGSRITPTPAAEDCPGFARDAVQRTQQEIVLENDASGRFCVRLIRPPPDARIKLAFEGDANYTPVERVLSVDTSKSALLLRFEPPPRVIPLERPRHSFWVETRLDPPPQSELAALDKVAIEVALQRPDGTTTVLGTEPVVAGERAQFVVQSKLLGSPGAGTLVARSAGTSSIAAAERRERVQLTGIATLQLAADIAEGDPRDGVPIRVEVSSDFGPVPAGSVEALVDGRSVGVSPVRGGQAAVVASFEPTRAGPQTVTLRYLPSAPWWLAGASLDVQVHVPPPSPWRRVPWIVLALGIAAWLMRAWYRPSSKRREEKRQKGHPPTGQPSIDVLERGPADRGWSGVVRDAHEGTPIEGATIRLIVPAFAGDGVVSSARADEKGRFELAPAEHARAEGSRLEVSARFHSDLERPVPPPGSISIQLVSRRRALVDRLVDWTRRQGKPWNQEGEATPEQIRGLAKELRQRDVAAWANAVEVAAYGADPPEAADEEHVREREPKG